MSALRIATIIFLPITLTVLLVIGLTFQGVYFWIVLGGFIVLDALLALFFKKYISRSYIFWYALPSVLLYAGIAASLIVVEESYLIKAILGAHIILQWLYFTNLYFLLYRANRYQERSFWHITMSLHIVSFFCFAVAMYGLMYYIDYNIFILIIPMSVLTIATYAQQLVIHGMNVREYWRFWCFQTFVVFEGALAIGLLPSSYLTKAFFLTVPFYISSQLGYVYLHKELSSKSFIVPVLLSAIMLLLVVITTSWR